MVFKISQAEKENVLHAFTGAPSDGYLPMSTLFFRRGIFKSTTFFGGPATTERYSRSASQPPPPTDTQRSEKVSKAGSNRQIPGDSANPAG
jgi:hypothetical protein